LAVRNATSTRFNKSMKRIVTKPFANYVVAGIGLFLFVSLISGCLFSRKHVEKEKSEQEIVQTAVEAYNKRDYYKAAENFQTTKDRYPFSQYAIMAQLKLGDSHYNLGQYAEAIYEYEEFVKLHPDNEAIPYVLYQTGMCYFKQMRGIDQDPLNTQKAAAEFQRLIQNYPNSPFRPKAENRLSVCLKNLAEHELYIARFYFKSKNYRAAKSRFEGILKNFPDLGEYNEAIQYIKKCDERLSMAEPKQEKK
jgi:outer membrane protein assembly factor BamD